MNMRKLEIGDVELSIQPEEEHEHYTDKSFGYAPEAILSFDEMVSEHGLWGWCYVTVRVIWRSIEGCDSIGCCSYKDEADFRNDEELLGTLIRCALDDLNAKVKDHLLEADEMRSELSLTFEEATRRRQMYKGLCWTGQIECPHCKADLRDHSGGVPYKRSIGVYSREQDRTTHWKCPDCGETWDRNER